jgi:phage shock protein PspC (stress-responsive transcriptional regulator)
MANNNWSRQPRTTKVAIVIGIVLVVYGVLRFLSLVMPSSVWSMLSAVLSWIANIAVPIVVIAVGALVIWAAVNGKFGSARVGTHGPLRRSVSDKALLGVCGGIARYFGISSSVVRVVAVILGVLSPWVMLIVYIILAVVMPSD